MKIAIIGAGAMGTLFACLLQRAGFPAWLLDRDSGLVAAVRENGLTLHDAGGSTRFSLSTVTIDPDDIGPVDLVIVFVKSYDTAEALGRAFPLFHKDTVVLTLQNGFNNLRTIAGLRGGDRLLGGTTAHGATLLSHGCVRHAGRGETVIGSFRGGAAQEMGAIAALLTRAGITTSVTGDLTTALWRKLIINAAINPLTALTRLSNGEIADHPELTAVQLSVVREACAVGEAQGIAIDPGDAAAAVMKVCSDTAANKSSMLQDVLNGKRTEIDYINGAIVAAGVQCNVPTPYNIVLTRLVKALEEQRFSPPAGCEKP